MTIWPFLCYFVYVIFIEVFINIRLNRLQHAIKILILTEIKKPEKAHELIAKYASLSFKELLIPAKTPSPVYLQRAMLQLRRTAGLRLMLHILGLIAVFVWLAVA